MKANREAVVAAYRGRDLPTLEAVATRLGTTFQNVQGALRQEIPQEDLRILAKLRYSASKTGAKNPMMGKTEKKHPRWKGLCEDQKGYLTILWKGKRHFAHHVVAAQKLGLKLPLPKGVDVHHIDDDKMNNAWENLAVVSKAGHHEIHYRQSKDALTLRLRKSTLAEALKLLTSP